MEKSNKKPIYSNSINQNGLEKVEESQISLKMIQTPSNMSFIAKNLNEYSPYVVS